jgi:hypothetical protein
VTVPLTADNVLQPSMRVWNRDVISILRSRWSSHPQWKLPESVGPKTGFSFQPDDGLYVDNRLKGAPLQMRDKGRYRKLSDVARTRIETKKERARRPAIVTTLPSM